MWFAIVHKWPPQNTPHYYYNGSFYLIFFLVHKEPILELFLCIDPSNLINLEMFGSMTT